MSEARNFVSAAISIEQEFRQLRVTQPIGFGWMSSDLNELGVAGDAANATAAKGEACAENGADAFLDLLARCPRFRSGAPRSGTACALLSLRADPRSEIAMRSPAGGGPRRYQNARWPDYRAPR